MPAENEQPVAEFWGGIFAFLSARLLFAVFLFFILLLGAWVAGAGLHDPDTCWLLGLGRYIVQHRGLPASDPFSFSFKTLSDQTFVMYQWLTELLFYGAFRLGGLVGLLLEAAIILAAAFIVVPSLTLEDSGAPRAWAIWLIILAVASACFHFLVRPEIFSYLCLSLWMQQLLLLRKRSSKIEWRRVATIAGIMAFWANLHTGFTSGLIVLVIQLATGAALAAFSKEDRQSCTVQTGLLSLAAAVAATLITPYGYRLWVYIPSLFFPSYKIQETLPLTFSNLKEWTYWPFFILMVTCLTLACKAFKAARERLPDAPCQPLLSLVVMLVSAGFAVFCRRLIPFAAIIMLMETGALWPLLNRALRQEEEKEEERAEKEGSSPPSFASRLDEQLRRLFTPTDIPWNVISLVLVIAGVFIITSGPVKPVLPQASKAFDAPFAAIDYLAAKLAGDAGSARGNWLSAPQFGDMMIWYLNPVPRLFIDTRFDMYGNDIVHDYQTLEGCRPGWESLMKKYDIDWVFLPAKSSPLVERLRREPGWSTWYTDEHAVILRRTSGAHPL